MEKTLLVLLHGPGQSPPAWQEVVSAVDPSQPMVAPWLKGLKPSEHGGFAMGAAIEAVADVIETRGVERADLAGYSLGGLVAARLAMAYPEKVGHLILISTPLVPDRKSLTQQRTIARMTPPWLFRGIPKEQVLAGLEALATSDLGIETSQITCPTLAIAAERDPVGRDGAERLAREAGAQTAFLPGSEPNLLRTQPGPLASLITQFCTTIPTT